MMRMTVLASGSKGNSTVISSSRTRVLVDAGLSCRELLKRMSIAGEDPAQLNAILEPPIDPDEEGLCAPGSQQATSQKPDPTYLPAVEYFHSGTRFSIGDIDITPFTIPHDAADPCGFVLESEGIRMALATDL